MVNIKANFDQSKKINILIGLFFLIATLEVFAEFYSLKNFIYILKPLLNPILILVYLISSKKKNPYFILALFFALVANIFFVSKDFSSLLLGSIFFLIFKIFVIYIVVKSVKVKNYLPVLLGTIPFMFVFLYITSITIDELGDQFYLYLVQVICICFLGGFSLANFIVDSNRMNYWLMLSAMLSTVIQFVLILRMYFLPVFIFQPMAMVLYAFAQFSLYKFVILSEVED